VAGKIVYWKVGGRLVDLAVKYRGIFLYRVVVQQLLASGCGLMETAVIPPFADRTQTKDEECRSETKAAEEKQKGSNHKGEDPVDIIYTRKDGECSVRVMYK